MFRTLDANEAVASVAYRLNEVIAIYPITPASPMGEWADLWSSKGERNLWGAVPSVIEMQSEGGAAGAVHGALQAGSLATTFTSSQGLLLMMPNMFKIAGELTSAVIHVAARTVATHALSIFCDHGDVMAVRSTGFAILASASVQEAMDFAAVSQAATLESRVPFLHFFDGFRTSHEIAKVEALDDAVLRGMIDEIRIREHRARALSPGRPVLRGTAQNPDVFFQAREAVNPYVEACPMIVERAMKRFAGLTGRSHGLCDYAGHPQAERVVVLMGSGCETAHETVDALAARGEKVGVVKVRLFRPFPVQRFLEALPGTVRSLAVLDRTKEPGSVGEPLFLDCLSALHEGLGKGWGRLRAMPRITGGRYGLSSKEFTPGMVKAVLDELSKDGPKPRFTVGIRDDVSGQSLEADPGFSSEPPGGFRALFYGLGSDGTVGANKNSIKIIGENTDHYAQGYFVYDSRKAGAVTISHLRFGPNPIRSAYLIGRADFVGCHQESFLGLYDILANAVPGGTFLLNAAGSSDEIWERLPGSVQEAILAKKLKFFAIDAYQVAGENGMGGRINTVMQVCFFAISNILPRDRAIACIKESIRSTYGKKGEDIVNLNLAVVDATLDRMIELDVSGRTARPAERRAVFAPAGPDFVREVIGEMVFARGDGLPVSSMPADGTFPTGTTRWEKRNLAREIPVWDPQGCIQCGKCAFACPHAVIRAKVADPAALAAAPASFRSRDAIDKEWKGMRYIIQVSPEDCTGCAICVDVCPARNKSETRLKAVNMSPQPPILEEEKANWEFFSRRPIAAGSMSSPSASSSCSSPSLNSPAPARDAARRLTSSSSPSFSETGSWSPTPPAVRPSMGATCPPPPGRRTGRAGARPGPTRSSRTTPNSDWACAFPWTSRRISPGRSSKSSPAARAGPWPMRSSPPTNRTKPASAAKRRGSAS